MLGAPKGSLRRRASAWLAAATLSCGIHAGDGPAKPAGGKPVEEIVVTPEPRYVAPTRRDRIGRIWAPVFINSQGPFRLVLDTGASHSGVIAEVAAALNIALDYSSSVTLRGVTGTAQVPTIRVDSFVTGDLNLSDKRLPIITTALGGADGVLGTEGLRDKRILIDFRNDLITITRSRKLRAPPGFITIPVKYTHGMLLTAPARMGPVRATAIIDTGGQATIANLATRDALYRKPPKQPPSIDIITGATADTQKGEGHGPPPIVIGDALQIRAARMTFGDMRIFEHWKMTDTPAILVGMDALGLLDTLIIDYPRSELQVRM